MLAEEQKDVVWGFCLVDSKYFSDKITIADLEAMRLVLSGRSVIDWFRLNFKTMTEINHFFRVNGFDLNNPQDQHRLQILFQEATDYLEEVYPKATSSGLVSKISSVRDLFTFASESTRRSEAQIVACMILKVMHTINHIDARELLHRCAISESKIYNLVDVKVRTTIDAMQQEGFHLAEFSGGSKNKRSMTTKLIARKENHAAAIYDKIRFRLVTRTKYDILPMLYFLGRNLCPFNYVIPGNTHNNLISFSDLVGYYKRFNHYSRYLKKQDANGFVSQNRVNEFSDSAFRAINFVCDIPLAVDDLINTSEFSDLGRIIHMAVEFQIMDEETFKHNETGTSRHENYKKKQIDAVKNRLGLT